MTRRISRCIICGKLFGSRKELREHKDKNHRITNSKIVPGGTKDADSSSSEESTSNNQKMIE
jgi:C2H2-type zinc finger